MQKSGNPALSKSALGRISALQSTSSATLGGTILKIVLLLIVLTASGVIGWRMSASIDGTFGLVMILSMIGALVFALISIFVPKATPITAPLYALSEGILLGAITRWTNEAYPGIALQAVLLTGAVLVSTLFLYNTGLVKVTAKFRAIVIIATVGIALYYFIAIILGLFGISMPLIYDTGALGIGFSLFVVVIAALNLFLDYDFINQTVQARAPKVFEWYGGFILLVTLIWLYIEILRLLSKIRSN